MNPLMSLFAGVAALGFATVFSVPRRALLGIFTLAVVAHLMRAALLHEGAVLPVASGVAALFVGLTAAVVAPQTRLATPIFAFAPVIPLLPGKYMFQALTGVLDLTENPRDASSLVDATAVDATIAMMTIIALAIGTIGPTLILGQRIRAMIEARQSTR